MMGAPDLNFGTHGEDGHMKSKVSNVTGRVLRSALSTAEVGDAVAYTLLGLSATSFLRQL